MTNLDFALPLNNKKIFDVNVTCKKQFFIATQQIWWNFKCIICTFIVPFSLGELTKVRIWHDNKFLKANWFLESVEIIDESNDEKYQFPCNRWLAKDKDDGSLIRELTCANVKKSNDSRSATSK